VEWLKVEHLPRNLKALSSRPIAPKKKKKKKPQLIALGRGRVAELKPAWGVW
jgi:hypothetical protein